MAARKSVVLQDAVREREESSEAVSAAPRLTEWDQSVAGILGLPCDSQAPVLVSSQLAVLFVAVCQEEVTSPAVTEATVLSEVE